MGGVHGSLACTGCTLFSTPPHLAPLTLLAIAIFPRAVSRPLIRTPSSSWALLHSVYKLPPTSPHSHIPKLRTPPLIYLSDQTLLELTSRVSTYICEVSLSVGEHGSHECSRISCSCACCELEDGSGEVGEELPCFVERAHGPEEGRRSCVHQAVCRCTGLCFRAGMVHAVVVAWYLRAGHGM